MTKEISLTKMERKKYGDSQWYKNLKKSSLTPPDYVFGIVWPILYLTLIIYAVFIARLHQEGKLPNNMLTNPIGPFLLQLILNILWSPVFFIENKIKLAFGMIILIILLTVWTFYTTFIVDKTISLILIPYLLWVSFASYLNGYIVFQNKL